MNTCFVTQYLLFNKSVILFAIYRIVIYNTQNIEHN